MAELPDFERLTGRFLWYAELSRAYAERARDREHREIFLRRAADWERMARQVGHDRAVLEDSLKLLGKTVDSPRDQDPA